MVLTRWTAQNGTPVLPQNASVFSGSAQFPVATGEIDFNVYALIDADLGGVFALFPDRAIVAVAWQVILSLSVVNPQSKSAFGGNPIRRKLGLITYAQGLYASNNEPINYSLQTFSRQNFLFAEGLPEPSLGVISALPIPASRDYIFTPTGVAFISTGVFGSNYGMTRALFSFDTGIVGIAEVSYVASFTGASLPLENNSILVSQL